MLLTLRFYSGKNAKAEFYILKFQIVVSDIKTTKKLSQTNKQKRAGSWLAWDDSMDPKTQFCVQVNHFHYFQ